MKIILVFILVIVGCNNSKKGNPPINSDSVIPKDNIAELSAENANKSVVPEKNISDSVSVEITKFPTLYFNPQVEFFNTASEYADSLNTCRKNDSLPSFLANDSIDFIYSSYFGPHDPRSMRKAILDKTNSINTLKRILESNNPKYSFKPCRSYVVPNPGNMYSGIEIPFCHYSLKELVRLRLNYDDLRKTNPIDTL